MKRMMLLPLIALMSLTSPPRDSKPTTLVTWTKSFETAKVGAAKAGRPILWFQLLGNFDEEFC